MLLTFYCHSGFFHWRPSSGISPRLARLAKDCCWQRAPCHQERSSNLWRAPVFAALHKDAAQSLWRWPWQCIRGFVRCREPLQGYTRHVLIASRTSCFRQRDVHVWKNLQCCLDLLCFCMPVCLLQSSLDNFVQSTIQICMHGLCV